MKTISRYIMTLALLLTAVTGAWATTDPNSVTWNYQTWKGWAENVTTHTVGDITITCSGNAKAYESRSSGEPLALQAGANDAITFTSNCQPFASIAIQTGNNALNIAGWTYNSSTWSYEWSGTPSTSVTLSGCDIEADVITFTFAAEAPITVDWNPSTKTGNFSMPGSDVVLTPLYAPAAKWAVVDNVEQLPAALEGIIAGEDKAIVTAGQSSQGTVMYAVTTTAEAAPDLTAFSATVPTAKTYDDATTVYVWYYIQGQDTPDGQQATEENTFNDSEISTTPLTVNILTNKFDIQFKAANDNTIEAGKATVTVGGTAATVTEGKLEGVKMGSEVKLKANTGYKFRKVEAKKTVIPMLNAAKAENIGMVVCNKGHLHDAKEAVPDGCTAVGILGKVTETGHGLILALKDATSQTWNTIDGWTSASYAGTTLKVLPDDAARGTNLTSYTTLGETTVSNWAVAQKSDYAAIFTNLGSTKNSGGMTYDNNVNAYITTGVGGTAMSGTYWSATQDDDYDAWYFQASSWYDDYKTSTYYVRPVLGF